MLELRMIRFPANRGRILLFSLIIAFLFVAIPGYSDSQPFPVQFRHISLRDGLSQSTVNCIAQDSYGFLWFGTDDGLNRWDGYRVTTYKHDPGDAGSIGGNFINTLYSDGSGVLWIGTTAGLNRFLPSSDSFTPCSLGRGPPEGIAGEIIICIEEDHKGNLWVGTNSGLKRMNRQRDRVFHYDLPPGGRGNRKKEVITAIREVVPGVLWIASSESGLFRCRLQDDSLEILQPSDFPEGLGSIPSINVLYRDPAGDIWLGTRGSGLFSYRPSLKQWRRYRISPESNAGDPEEDVKSICRDRSGRLWIATFGGGLVLFDPDRGSIMHCLADPNRPGSLSSNTLRNVYESRSGILWVGTQGGGVDIYDPDQRKLSPSIPFPGILSGESISSVCEDRRGNLWIGTSNKGLLRFDPRTGHSDFAHTLDGAPGCLRRNRTTALFEDRFGDLWIGTYGGGLCRLDQRSGLFTRFSNDSGNPASLSSDYVVWICEDSSGVLWIATHNGGGFPGGLNRLNRHDMTFSRFLNREEDPESLSYNGVNVVFDGGEGVLWVGTFHGGLNRFDTRNGRFRRFVHRSGDSRSLSHHCVTSIFKDDQGRLWVGTLDGLNCMEPGSDTFHRYNQGDGLANGVIYGILGDAKRRIWLSTNKGISRLDPDQRDIKNYDSSDGLVNTEFNMGAFFRAKSGRLFFGGIDGLDVLNPLQIKDNPYVPPVRITGLQVFARGQKLLNPYMKSDSIMEGGEVRLPHYANDLSLTFVALNYSSPEKNRYAFKMEGADPDWTYRDASQRFAAYRGLKPGRYLFRVKGSNNNNVWNEKGASVFITITPPFWQTGWFRLGFLFSFAILSYFAIHFLRTHFKMIAFWKNRRYIGSYEIDEQIGSGGMGIIYRVHPLTDKKRSYAMKVLRGEFEWDETQKKRLANEARVIDRIDHPNIVRIIERGEYNRQPYIVMELLEGSDLRETIRDEGMMNVGKSLIIASQVCGALVELHREKILHRDLKPENILMLKSEKPEVKLLDFGLARSQVATTRFTESGQIMGTVPYMPPELIAGKEIDPSADVYSLGVILYEMLAGKKPFSGETTLDLYRAILKSKPAPLLSVRSDIPSSLNRLVMDMLSREPERRPAADQVLAALLEI